MADLLSARGTIYRVSKVWQGSQVPYFAVDHALFQSNSEAGFIIIDDIKVSEKDAFAKYACLENKKVFYLFGKHFGSIQINCTAYLGRFLTEHEDSVVADALEELRVSTSLQTMRAQAGLKVYQFFLTDYTIGGMNPELHARNFTLHGVLVDK